MWHISIVCYSHTMPKRPASTDWGESPCKRSMSCSVMDVVLNRLKRKCVPEYTTDGKRIKLHQADLHTATVSTLDYSPSISTFWAVGNSPAVRQRSVFQASTLPRHISTTSTREMEVQEESFMVHPSVHTHATSLSISLCVIYAIYVCGRCMHLWFLLDFFVFSLF